ncbi:MAG: hypothetical protein CVU95_03390 [Firmicutes bacterium HGW-Firmicutes-2]|jgi:hypothetical protein|nr:MAG: hypothetical protein CVU95_03390 [Firmicutes bacterium HGW-Firmicutes-2]
MNYFNNLWNSFMTGIPNILVAIIYLIIAFIVALIAKKIIMGILHASGAEKLLERTGIKDEKTGKSTEFIGKLVFLIVFLLFLPAVLVRLGMNNVGTPITNVVESVIGFLPRFIAAALILYIGVYVAEVIKQLVKALLKGIGLDKIQKRLGVEASDQNTFAGVIAGIVYVFILIPVFIAALQVLGLDAVVVPATILLTQVFSYVPRIFVAVVLLLVGYQLANLLAPVVESLLVSVGAYKLTDKVFAASSVNTTSFSISKVIGQIVRWLIMIIFFIEAVNLLNLAILTNIGNLILMYLPFVVSAIIIMGGGIVLASWVEQWIIKHSPKQKAIALIAKVFIVILAVFMTLSQLGFAESIVNLAFVIILTGASLAFAIAFGVGGRDFAANRLRKLEKKIDDVPETHYTPDSPLNRPE